MVQHFLARNANVAVRDAQGETVLTLVRPTHFGYISVAFYGTFVSRTQLLKQSKQPLIKSSTELCEFLAVFSAQRICYVSIIIVVRIGMILLWNFAHPSNL